MKYSQLICFPSYYVRHSSFMIHISGELTVLASILCSSDNGTNALPSRPKYPLVHKSIQMGRDSEVLLPLWRRPLPRKWVKVSGHSRTIAWKMLLMGI